MTITPISKPLLLSLFLTYSLISIAQKDIDIYNNKSESLDIVNSIEVLTDTSSGLTLKEILASDKFVKYGNRVPNLGVSPYAHWLKLKIQNTTDAGSLILEIDNSVIDTMNFYYQSSDGKWEEEKTGEYVKISDRKYKDQNFIFRIEIPKDQTKTFYMRVRSGDIIVLPMSLTTPQVSINLHLEKELVFGIYAGIIIVMFLYNLFLYFTVRDSNYLYYVSYIIFVGLTQIILQGFSYKYLWPDSPRFANQSLILFAALAGISIVLFLKQFLQVPQNTPRLNKGLYVIIAGYCIAVPLRIFGDHNITYSNISYNLADVLAGLIGFYSLIIAIVISIKGNRSAKFFLIAWTMFLIGMFCFVLKNFGILPYNNFTNYSMPLGNAVEVILLSFALADRINILKKDKEESQLEALNALRENERIIKQQNVLLDTKVKERTQELQESNEELNSTLKNLKDTQSRLVDAEKMASLGQLTAGIAHEINNPINFVSNSVKPLRRDMDDILALIEKYQKISPQSDLENQLKEINSFKEKIDLEYLREEINVLINGIDEGATRTAEIVQGLKSFSRLDENNLKIIDVHEGIDSTLRLLNRNIGENISIIKNYAKLDKIECYPGKINQVFMNILNNATHAINLKPDKKGSLVISTEDLGENIIIKIKDDGIGIPENIKNRIFEPFFTTKDVGQGTGLGLSIVYNIVEAHHGNISVDSKVGSGTEFTITLPKSQKK